MVSIIIPTYNVERYIGRCLDSVLGQSYKDIEVIVVDDASTDHSLAIAEQYQSQHPSIRIIRHEQNRGLMTTRRDGYMAASGDFLMFVDSDDALPADAVQKLVCRQAESDADIVMGDMQKIYVNGRTERIVGSLQFEATKTDVLSSLLACHITHSLCGKIFKTTLLQDKSLRYFENLTIAEDGCLFYQLVANADNNIVSLSDIVYDYYENKASSSQHAYGPKQIDNMMSAYCVMADACRPYQVLYKQLERRLTKVAFTFYFERIPRHTVKELLHKHDLSRYGSVLYACKYLSWKDCWFFVKRFIYVRTMLSND